MEQKKEKSVNFNKNKPLGQKSAPILTFLGRATRMTGMNSGRVCPR